MNTELILARNAANAEGLRKQDLALLPRLRTIVLTCADHRTDPAHVLGLEPGDAVVIRNPGGRVTPDVAESLIILATVAGEEGLPSGIEFVIMHHTDCGISRLVRPEHASILAAYRGVDPQDVDELHVQDPDLAVANDVNRLRSFGLLSEQTRITGVVFDLATGLVRVVSSG